MSAIQSDWNLTSIVCLAGRMTAFIAFVGLSVPLSAELAIALPDLLPKAGIREAQFGWLVDEFVLNLMVNWPLLVLGPVSVVATLFGSLPEANAMMWTCVAWTPIALAYAWGTRSRHLYFFVLSIYPIVWLVGVLIQLGIKAVAA